MHPHRLRAFFAAMPIRCAPLGLCVVLSLLVVPHSPAVPAQVENGGGVPSHMPCEACEGSGKKECPKCEGEGENLERCETCNARGEVKCKAMRCEKGRRECTNCRGRGYKVREVIGGEAKRIPCKTCDRRGHLDCKRCEKGKVRCKVCKGARKTPVRCDTCRGKEKVDCETCDGAGQLPTKKMDRRCDEYLHLVENRFLKARKIVTTAVGTRDELVDEYAAFETKLDAHRKSLSHYVERKGDILPALLQPLDDLDERWEAVQLAGRERLEALQKVDRLLEQHDRTADASASAEAEAIGLRSSYYLISSHELLTKIRELRPPAEEAEELADDLEAATEILVQRHETYDSRLNKLISKLTTIKRQQGDIDADAEAEAARLNDFSARAKRFEEGLVTAAARLGFVGITVTPVDGDPSFAMDVVLKDQKAEPALAAEAVELTEEFLEDVPKLVTAAFAAPESIGRLFVSIEGRVTGDTGHHHFESCQQFTFERNRWQELTTGNFKEDWQEQLARSSPSPTYPRAREMTLDQILLIGIPSLCGLAIVVFVGFRFFRDWGSWQRV